MRSSIAALLGAMLATGAHAAEQKLPAELLEFLGGLDAEEPGWQDYLAGTDVTKVPASAAPVPAKPPADKVVATEPGATEPAVTKPGATKPAAAKPAAAKPGTPGPEGAK